MLPNVTQEIFDPEMLIVGLEEKEIKSLVLKIFNYRCAVCNSPAGTIHEMAPRARGKKSLTFRNRIALCNTCHDIEHHFGASPERIMNLQTARQTYLILCGHPEYV